jgi:hypothetical protein
MNLLSIIEALRRNLKTVVLGCYAVLALVVIADVVRALAAHGHEAPAAAEEPVTGFWATLFHAAETIPVFWTAFGILGCVLLVIVSKAIVGPVVSKPEDFYDE